MSCTQCGATSPGLRCDWQNNYTQCAPCASLTTCPICLVDYSEGTIIVQCRQCDRCALFLRHLSALEDQSLQFLNMVVIFFPPTLSYIHRWFHASCQSLHSEEDIEKAADSNFDCTMCRAFKTSKGRSRLVPLYIFTVFFYRLNRRHCYLALYLLSALFNAFCVFCATAVVFKAREAIEPVVMTHVVTKAKDMGECTLWKVTDNK